MANAIELDAVSKLYRLGAAPSTTIRETVTGTVRRLVPRAGGTRDGAPGAREAEVWALRDVDLAIPEGTSVGIVGRNGAGKSTLLKILSRITEPTAGVSRTRGVVGALLEVGTGFHPELTGRENVFLNAAILGMPRSSVLRRFDEIVEFSGIGRYIDTPVKRYSSGMYLRLAFAVAAHIEADVLLVDEVLAVGDTEFQRRCLGKMEELGRSGRTVVFISHNLEAVVRLCETSLWLDSGRVREVGPTSMVVDAYLLDATPDAGVRTFVEDADAPVSLRALRIGTTNGGATGRIKNVDPVVIELDIVARAGQSGLNVAVSVESLGGTRVMDEALSDTSSDGQSLLSARPGEYLVTLTLPPLLMPGEYVVNVWLGTPYETYVWEQSAGRLRLEGGQNFRPNRLLTEQGAWAVIAQP